MEALETIKPETEIWEDYEEEEKILQSDHKIKPKAITNMVYLAKSGATYRRMRTKLLEKNVTQNNE